MIEALAPIDRNNQADLKRALQGEKDASKLERLAAVLLGRLLGVPIAVANAGFQHGGDGGPAGRQGRRFRVEAKKYGNKTRLSDRELLGEVDHALARDEALEAWILVATRAVPEQLEQDLRQKGERLGVPVVILGWQDHGLAPLAALCASGPDFVEEIFSPRAGALARALRPASAPAIEEIRRDLQSWTLGFESLRARSHKRLDRIWNSPKTSNAELGQDAAGGARNKKVRRRSVHEALEAWWRGAAAEDAPMAVIGWDGVGKTWAGLDWLVDRKAELPVILVVPASAASELRGASEAAVRRFLADRLHELCGTRDQEHWLRRLDRLLKRPPGEGPVLTVFFDGLNQAPSAPWLPLLKALQGEAFEGRVRVLAGTRNHHWTDKLSRLRGLVVPAEIVEVGAYDAAPGGELDRMLAFEGLERGALHPDLVELARTPRLFELVVRFRDRLVEAGRVTVHRLLWEYGRDTLGHRAGRSFSEDEWRDWLKEVARTHRDGVREFSRKALADTAGRRDLTEGEVFARLSDIIDGRLTERGPSGALQFTPTIVAHALGAALLAELDAIPDPAFAAVEAELARWLDPIAGLDERAEILRAAVSILVERGDSASAPAVAGALVTAWLQTQNIAEGHRKEIVGLAADLREALLDAVEHSRGHAQAAARLCAVNALRAIPRTDTAAMAGIAARIGGWFRIVSRDVDPRLELDASSEKHRAERFIDRVGVDASGPLTVLGQPLLLVDRDDGALLAAAPSILEGMPLVLAEPVFEVAAAACAVAYRSAGWSGLKWLCLLNELDPGATAAALRVRSEEVRRRVPEPGVNPALPARAASLLLWLTGEEGDEDAAAEIDPGLDRVLTYEEHYLPRPGRSFFTLERRHAEEALLDAELSVLSRAQRVGDLWFDPTFEPPASFVKEVRREAAAVDIQKLGSGGSRTIEDHCFEELEPALARCAPDLLADLHRRKLRGLCDRPAEARYWSAVHARGNLVLGNGTEVEAARALRSRGREADDSHEAFAATQLLAFELLGLGAQDQIALLIGCDLKFLLTDLAALLRQPTLGEIDASIARFGGGPPKQVRDLVVLLSLHAGDFSDAAWDWLEGLAFDPGSSARAMAFETLSRADAARFGRALLERGWSWSAAQDFQVNHYGTRALLEAARAVPFERLMPRIAPWRLLEAVRRRGGDAVDARLAASAFGSALTAEEVDEPDPGSELSVDRRGERSAPLALTITTRPTEDADGLEEGTSYPAPGSDARTRSHRRAVDAAVERIRSAREAGAALYLADIDAADLRLVLDHAPEIAAGWLEGAAERTAEFRRRVRLAEGAYLALCETLLDRDPERGVVLWRALRRTVATRFLGAAGIDDLLHMPFRAPDSPPVAALRCELLGLGHCNTDSALRDIAIAAHSNGKAEWLEARIGEDRASPFGWRRRRAVVLAGFGVGNTLPVPEAWPDGELRTAHADLCRRSARCRFAEACSRHWWRTFAEARDPAEAYVCWVLFLRSADGRARLWMSDGVGGGGDDPLRRAKAAHLEFNRSALKSAMDKRLDKLDRHFLDRDVVDGVGPWGKERP